VRKIENNNPNCAVELLMWIYLFSSTDESGCHLKRHPMINTYVF